ncbi:MAG: hypothetical protein JWQ40_4007 [Segetibacter sp.]|nr:hypothetical protein [Segetibacter sp.]
MIQLHKKTTQQQQWRKVFITNGSIELFRIEGHYCMLLALRNEFTYKRPENIGMQKQ